MDAILDLEEEMQDAQAQANRHIQIIGETEFAISDLKNE